jgi:hypothetical protein
LHAEPSLFSSRAQVRGTIDPSGTRSGLNRRRAVFSGFPKFQISPMKTIVCLPSENGEWFWSEDVGWEIDGRVEHDGIVWLAVLDSDSGSPVTGPGRRPPIFCSSCPSGSPLTALGTSRRVPDDLQMAKTFLSP